MLAAGTSNVYIRGLPCSTTDADLASLCAPYGEILSAKAILDLATGECKGFGFVLFGAVDAAHRTVAGINANPWALMPGGLPPPAATGGVGSGGMQARMARESFTAKLKILGDSGSSNIYFSNLPLYMGDEELSEMLSGWDIRSTRVLRDANGESRGVGFARLGDRDEAQSVIDQFNRVTLVGGSAPLQVRFADSPAQKVLKSVAPSASVSVSALAATVASNSTSGDIATAAAAPPKNGAVVPLAPRARRSSTGMVPRQRRRRGGRSDYPSGDLGLSPTWHRDFGGATGGSEVHGNGSGPMMMARSAPPPGASMTAPNLEGGSQFSSLPYYLAVDPAYSIPCYYPGNPSMIYLIPTAMVHQQLQQQQQSYLLGGAGRDPSATFHTGFSVPPPMASPPPLQSTASAPLESTFASSPESVTVTTTVPQYLVDDGAGFVALDKHGEPMSAGVRGGGAWSDPTQLEQQEFPPMATRARASMPTLHPSMAAPFAVRDDLLVPGSSADRTAEYLKPRAASFSAVGSGGVGPFAADVITTGSEAVAAAPAAGSSVGRGASSSDHAQAL
ncbi:hypothetical protein BC828DRAFT_395901 [Blastocladiella britannica]|nr:hypothetical protein BC828DRAFT_395901 [Blastocladiella britannica]